MNREIKFRVWDKDANKWVGGLMYCVDNISKVKKEWHILMQFTGLTDKNGREIFEGDIIEYQSTRKHYKGVVTWEYQSCSWQVKWTDKAGISRYATMWASFSNGENYSHEHLTIIGNLYENSELLNDKS